MGADCVSFALKSPDQGKMAKKCWGNGVKIERMANFPCSTWACIRNKSYGREYVVSRQGPWCRRCRKKHVGKRKRIITRNLKLNGSTKGPRFAYCSARIETYLFIIGDGVDLNSTMDKSRIPQTNDRHPNTYASVHMVSIRRDVVHFVIGDHEFPLAKK